MKAFQLPSLVIGWSLSMAALSTLPGSAGADGTIVVWGSDYHFQWFVPAPNAGFAGISIIGYVSAAVRSGWPVDGEVEAWGPCGWHGQCDVPPPNEGFIAAAVGICHVLGLKGNGSILAWGSNYKGACNVPQPNSGFIAVAAGEYYSLGLRADGSVAAWGGNDYGQCVVPEPNDGFVAISTMGRHALGLRSNGSIAAWGWNYFGQCDVPDPNTGFVGIAAGWGFSAGIRPDGSIVAWGSNYYGQCDVPEPNSGFTAIAAGDGLSLGLKNSLLGACCHPSGYCAVTIEEWCESRNNWLGVGTTCAPEPCWLSSVRADESSRLPISVSPNPTSGWVSIRLLRGDAPPGTVEILDVAGRLVRRFESGEVRAAGEAIQWDGRSGSGVALPSGVYLVRASGGAGSQSATVVLLR